MKSEDRVGSTPLRVAFAGTPEFAAVALRALLAARFDIPLVLTQPDRPAGRGMQLQESAVKAVAREAGIPVAQPERLRSPEQQAALADCAPDVLVVAAYGLILPQAVLDLPRLGCLNIHASLLPRWRGAAPIHRAIEAGDRETGITIMQMDAGLDTGAMLMRSAIAIDDTDTTGSLHDRLAGLGGEMIVEALQALATGTLQAVPQDAEGVSYAHKITKSESALDWTQDAAVLARRVRAFDPFPGCTVEIDGVLLKVWAAGAEARSGTPGEVLAVEERGILVGCGTGSLRLRTLQKPGGKRLSAMQLLQGFPLVPGQRFSAGS